MKKKTGITWSIQVIAHMPLVKPMGFEGDTVSELSSRIVNTQCHTTTTTSENARRKST